MGSRIFIAILILFAGQKALSQTHLFEYTGTLETFVIPEDVFSIRIEAMGAQGASADTDFEGGRGARMSGTFSVIPGSTLLIVVGERGHGEDSGTNGGGGGGSYVVLLDPDAPYTMTTGTYMGQSVTPLIVAGGGGGTRNAVEQNGHPGVITQMGTSGSGSLPSGGGIPTTVATGGGDLSSPSWGSGGGGFILDGIDDGSLGCGGKAFLNGSFGGSGCGDSGHTANGGFGGGGQGRGSWGGGGGGGYSGGQGGRIGGGGGSYNIGTDQDNQTGYKTNDGSVSIEILCSPLALDAPTTTVCLGDSLMIYAESLTGDTITWSGGLTNGEFYTPPAGATIYTASSTGSNDCPLDITITATPAPGITAHTSTFTPCEGAPILLWGEGGDTYSWSGDGLITPTDSGFFAAEPGTTNYTLTGALFGCEGTPVNITITSLPHPAVSGVATPPEICIGESYTLAGMGGLSYDWGEFIGDDGDFTPPSFGTYVHHVIGYGENGCTDTAEVTVPVYPLPTIKAGLDRTLCQGYETTLNPTGGISYSWSPEITAGVPFIVLPGSTTYAVTGTDENGCSNTDEITIIGVERPSIVSATITDELFGFDGTINLSLAGGSGTYIYNWSHGPETEDVFGLTHGTYTVTIDDVTIQKGACSIDSAFTVNSFVSLTETPKTDQIQVYPNPTSTSFRLSIGDSFSYEIHTPEGKRVLLGKGKPDSPISIAHLPNGIYFIYVFQSDRHTVLPLVKN